MKKKKNAVGRPPIDDPKMKTKNIAVRIQQWKLEMLLPIYSNSTSEMVNSALDHLIEKIRGKSTT